MYGRDSRGGEFFRALMLGTSLSIKTGYNYQLKNAPLLKYTGGCWPMKPSLLFLCLLVAGSAGCSSRIYLRQPPCEAGLQLQTERCILTFRKQDVLDCAADVVANYRRPNPDFVTELNELTTYYAADTAKLSIIPDVDEQLKFGYNEAAFRKGGLFYIVDGCLIKRGRFCAVDKRTMLPLPWVRMRLFKLVDEGFWVLCAPNGAPLYQLHHP